MENSNNDMFTDIYSNSNQNVQPGHNTQSKGNEANSNQKPTVSKKSDASKKGKGKGKGIVSLALVLVMTITGATAYRLSKKAINGQLATPLVNTQDVDEETAMWLLEEQQTFAKTISEDQEDERMQIEVNDENKDEADIIAELENYLYITNKIMELKDFETQIKNVDLVKEEKVGFDELDSLIECYNKLKRVNVTDYSREALEKDTTIKKLATLYKRCEDYFKEDSSIDTLSSTLYLACSDFCGGELGLSAEEKAKHEIEVSEDENGNCCINMSYGNQTVQYSKKIVESIIAVDNLANKIAEQGDDYTLMPEDVDIMNKALRLAKIIVFTNPERSYYSAKIKGGNKLTYRPNPRAFFSKSDK